MWTSKNCGRYDRSKLRYPSDLTDDEWGLVEPLIPRAEVIIGVWDRPDNATRMLLPFGGQKLKGFSRLILIHNPALAQQPATRELRPPLIDI